jgi:hypothetical protein
MKEVKKGGSHLWVCSSSSDRNGLYPFAHSGGRLAMIHDDSFVNRDLPAIEILSTEETRSVPGDNAMPGWGGRTGVNKCYSGIPTCFDHCGSLHPRMSQSVQTTNTVP